MRIGQIAELWVYPVKSMRGLRVPSVMLDAEGIRGDRRFAIESSNAPVGKPLLTGRERANMLLYTPETSGEHFVRTPQGQRFPMHSLSLLQSFAVHKGDSGDTFALKASPSKPLTDVRPVSLVSTATLNALNVEMKRLLDPQRFRSNIVLELHAGKAFDEDNWSGRILCFGEADAAAELSILERIPRCRMVSLDPQTAHPDNDILRHLARSHEGRVGMYASPRHAGMLRIQQPVYLL